MRHRKKLPHNPPLGIIPEEEIFFITICSRVRKTNELLERNRAKTILQAVARRHEQGIWYARVFLVMPDHVHSLLRFSNPEFPLRKAIQDFKRWTARSGGFQWQDDFFDHRLRRQESVNQKADYILMNPVRAGLVESSDLWPHQFIATDSLG